MTTSQNDPNKPGTADLDDLTRFLDEDFGTEEVDLFEFTSGEEESPLTQLKTIVLGLDWEITDEALQDLSDEIEHLRHLEQFEHDKVTQVYLQALDKIGNYILSEGANAHSNSIKLLLSLYYDFEKIISSEIITGAEITALLKADVRKFKILQYQIAQKHGATVPEATAAAAELPLTDHKTLLDIHAAILELDWEVSDEGLARLSEQLDILKNQFSGNKYIQIIVQGLSTLNNYIDEERARTHPESFSLLHHFFEALETLVDDKNLDEEKSQKLLINCVNRLNTLKSLITQTPQVLDEEAISEVAEDVDEIGEEKAAEEPIAETAPETEEAVAFTAPTAVEDEYEDELDVVLPTDETGEVAPALIGSEEETSTIATEEEAEAPPEELAEKLDFFFGGDDAPAPPPEEEVVETVEEETPADEPIAEAAPETEVDDIAITAPVAEEDEYEDELDVELPVDEAGEVAPALSDSAEDGGFGGVEEIESPPEELEEKLQFFFGEEEESFEPEAVEEAVEQKKVEEEELAAAELKEVEEREEELSVTPALSGEPEEAGFSADSTEFEAPPDGLEEKLEFFFGDDKAPEPGAEAAVEEIAPADEEVAPESLFEDEEEVLLTPEFAADQQEVMSDSIPGEYSAAMENMRTEFQKREQSLMDEITSLKAEIESLKSQLQ